VTQVAQAKALIENAPAGNNPFSEDERESLLCGLKRLSVELKIFR